MPPLDGSELGCNRIPLERWKGMGETTEKLF
jgi:hypothetical protein